MTKQRVVWVDIAKYFCMIAVMAEHTAFLTDKLDAFFEPFYLNLFSFCAGYVYIHKDSFLQFGRKKVRQLLVPWFFFSMIVILSSHILSFGEHASLKEELIRNFLQIRYYGGEMWYISALFVAFLPFYFFISRYEHAVSDPGRKTTFLIVLSFLLSLASTVFSLYAPRDLFFWSHDGLPVTLPWHLEYMFQAMFYMVLGYLFRIRWEGFYDHLNGKGFCVLLWILYLFIDFIFPAWVGGLSRSVSLFYYYLKALCGISAFVSLSKLIPFNRYMDTVGRNTLIYYGLHGKAESVLQHMLWKINADFFSWLQWGGTEWAALAAVLEALVISVLLVPVVLIINRWFPFLVGKTKQQKTMPAK